MNRRAFVAILASTAAWPRAANAQARPIPVIGFLGSQSADRELLAKFHQGINEWGYFEGRNVSIEYHWAENNYGRLPELAADLVRRQVALIVTSGGFIVAKAAKQATTTIPILFISGLDPVGKSEDGGLVASLSRPGGNATGVTHDPGQLTVKRLEMLRELLRESKNREPLKIAYLTNDNSIGLGHSQKQQIANERATAAGLGLMMLYAKSESDIEVALTSAAHAEADALIVTSDPLFIRQRALIVALTERYALPASYRNREFVDAGGLMSYGPSLPESWRQIGRYAGQILSGARTVDLPVMFQRKLELAINARTAKALGLTIPPLLRAIADEVLE